MDFRSYGIPFPIPYPPSPSRKDDKRPENDIPFLASAVPYPWATTMGFVPPPFIPTMSSALGPLGLWEDQHSSPTKRASHNLSTGEHSRGRTGSPTRAGHAKNRATAHAVPLAAHFGATTGPLTPVASLSSSPIALESALREMHHTMTHALAVWKPYLSAYGDHTANVDSFAEPATRDALWRDMLDAKLRDANERRRYDGAADRLREGLRQVRAELRETHDTGAGGESERRRERCVRVARKAVVACEGIVALAGRAAGDRMACKDLVEEMEETARMLRSAGQGALLHVKAGGENTGDDKAVDGEDIWNSGGN